MGSSCCKNRALAGEETSTSSLPPAPGTGGGASARPSGLNWHEARDLGEEARALLGLEAGETSAETEAAEKAAAEKAKAEKAAAEKAKADKAAAEKAKADKAAADKAAAEKAAAEKAAADKAAAEKAAAEKAAAAKAAAAKAAAEKEKARKAAAAKAAAEKAAAEKAAAEKAAAEKAAAAKAAAEKAAAEKAAAEKAKSAAAAKAKELEKLERVGRELEEKYGAIFQEIDTSGDGQADLGELQAFVAKDPVRASQLGIGNVDKFVQEADTDGDGDVSREEFLAYYAHINLDADKCYNALFDAIDADSSEELTFAEVRDYEWFKNPKLCQLLGINNWHSMISRMDADGDGKISRAEFVKYMKDRQSGHDQGEDLSFADVDMAKPVPAWKQARSNPALEVGAKGAGKAGKKRKGKNDCWDFAAGYCWRGNRCHYDHDATMAVSKTELDSHHQAVVKQLHATGVNLNHQAIEELQTLKIEDACEIIRSVGHKGPKEYIADKNRYVIGTARRMRMQAGSGSNPEWQPNKRPRHG